ncbi:MAG: AraC family transcriptional regulator [Burkholderiaceae bacterium]|jgi:AraC-like DNA-binding protein
MVDAVDLYNACLFIQDNLDADLSLMFLAQTVGLSRFRFHRVFKAWRGETLHDFVTRLRMERAAFELSYPVPSSNRRSVKAIAFASGYKSLSSFSHAFSSYASVSPRQFRYRMLHDRAQLTRSGHLAALAGARAAFRAPSGSFAPFSVTIREEPERSLVIVDSAAPGYRRAPIFGHSQQPIYGVESMPGLFARTQRRHGLAGRSLPMACIGVESEVWERNVRAGAVDRKTVRRATVNLKGGRYAVFDGTGSIAQLYRLWRRHFDGWLQASAECPRPDQVFVRFPDGSPVSIGQPVHLTLYIPLEPNIGRHSLRRLAESTGLAAA